MSKPVDNQGSDGSKADSSLVDKDLEELLEEYDESMIQRLEVLVKDFRILLKVFRIFISGLSDVQDMIDDYEEALEDIANPLDSGMVDMHVGNQLLKASDRASEVLDKWRGDGDE